jgi:hypothetical protein
MKLLAYSAAAALLAFSTVIPAAAEPAKKGSQTEPLQQAIKEVMVVAVNQSAQSKRPQDADQGDDNASPTAILIVCTKDTPAARRAAICDRPPVSPD